jgi:hypothetical protein
MAGASCVPGVTCRSGVPRLARDRDDVTLGRLRRRRMAAGGDRRMAARGDHRGRRDGPGCVRSRRRQGVTPERLRPTTPARIRLIDTSLRVDTVSPRKAMPITAVPAAPMPVHTA